jgi:hypothetical protein
MLLLAWYSWASWGTPLALGQGQGLAGFDSSEPLIAVPGLLLSPNRGLLAFSPMFVFSILWSVHMLRGRLGPPLLRYLVWSSLALLAVYSLWAQWPGGHTYGYRFLIELTPGLMLLLARAWPAFVEPRPLMRVVFMVTLLLSIYVHGIGADAAPCGFDDEPNNIDLHHERLWDITDGEIARCTSRELTAWGANLQRLAQPGVHPHA